VRFQALEGIPEIDREPGLAAGLSFPFGQVGKKYLQGSIADFPRSLPGSGAHLIAMTPSLFRRAGLSFRGTALAISQPEGCLTTFFASWEDQQ